MCVVNYLVQVLYAARVGLRAEAICSVLHAWLEVLQLCPLTKVFAFACVQSVPTELLTPCEAIPTCVAGKHSQISKTPKQHTV